LEKLKVEHLLIVSFMFFAI